ncbi:MAG TPA: helix-turn-helix transcriptional regulator [Acidobacteriaceae bacterium]|nr:helix-turn-helix transcriptional regulator [Acidobacteriaceae bacterium]
MTGSNLKGARLKAGLTQHQAASTLGLTQAYLSMVESGRRPVTPSVAARASQAFDLPPTALPMEPENSLSLNDEELKADLGALGYPGFSYLRGKPARNPTQLLSYALNQADLDVRVVEALPWMTSTYVDMDWDWLVGHAKQHDRQNRLGFVVTVAKKFAERAGDSTRAEKLNRYQELLDPSRLAREDTLCHDSMTQAERRWLHDNRTPEARHWNLLTDLNVDHLAYEPLSA